MAADNDKFGKWQNISIDVPDVLEETRERINTVAEFLLLILDIALAALNVVKVFVATFLNPIAALLNALIQLINDLIRDLRNIGIYLSGDWNLLEYPFADLQGGFGEYERRMIARLADRTDPTRPDLSNQIKLVGIFLYSSTDATGIAKLVRFIRIILSFFNQELPSGTLPTPVVQDVKYGVGTIGDTALSFSGIAAAFSTSATPPDIARVFWTVRPPTSKNPINPFPAPPPSGFMVSVSTISGGISLVYDRPRGSDAREESATTGDQIQPRESGPVIDGSGRPIVLYGGADEISFPKSLGYNKGVDSSGNPKDGSARVWGYLDATKNSPVALELLQDGDTRFLQSRFLVSAEGLNFLNWQATGFSLELVRDQLPRHAEFTVGGDGKVEREDRGLASTYYVRVATITDDQIPLIGDPDATFSYDLTGAAGKTAEMPGQLFQVAITDGLDPRADRSPWSDPAQVTYPNANTGAYLEAIQAALAVLILSRSDMPLVDDLYGKGSRVTELIRSGQLFLPDVALEATGLEDFKDLFDLVYEDFQADLNDTLGDPAGFRRDLKNRVHRATLDMYRRTGTLPSLEARVVSEAQDLLELTWSEILAANSLSQTMSVSITGEDVADQTILESLEPVFPDAENGLAISPWAIGSEDFIVDVWRAHVGIILGQSPYFIVSSRGEGDPSLQPVFSATAAEATALLETAHPMLRMFYEKFIQVDGTLVIPQDPAEYLQGIESTGVTISSGDRSPVFYTNRNSLINVTPPSAGGLPDGSMVFCRTLFSNVEDNKIYSQARTVLTLAAAVLRRPPNDGEWIAIRFFDMLPAIEDFLEVIRRWIRAIEEALRGIAEAIIGFIEFLESRIIELQQLIRRINALLQSLLLFSFPSGVSGLMLISDGTDGLLGDLTTAQEKPSTVLTEEGTLLDGPNTYGAGVAIVAALAPTFLLDLFVLSEDPNDPALIVQPPQDAFGVADLPQAPVIGPDVEDEEPDVL